MGESLEKPKLLETANYAGVGKAAITVTWGRPLDVTATSHQLPHRCHSRGTCAGDRQTCGAQKTLLLLSVKKIDMCVCEEGHGDLQEACTT